MKQLTMGVILHIANSLQKEGMSAKEIAELPIYIGNDDELNGIHCAWYVQKIDRENADDAPFIELINEDSGNFEVDDKAILIS